VGELGGAGGVGRDWEGWEGWESWEGPGGEGEEGGRGRGGAGRGGLLWAISVSWLPSTQAVSHQGPTRFHQCALKGSCREASTGGNTAD
jgi:hypothetical protein